MMLKIILRVVVDGPRRVGQGLFATVMRYQRESDVTPRTILSCSSNQRAFCSFRSLFTLQGANAQPTLCISFRIMRGGF